MGLIIGIVGSTGAVGQKMIEILMERKLEIDELRLFASQRSAGQKIRVEKLNKDIEVELLTEDVMKENYDYLLFAAGGDISKVFAKIAADAGNMVIDNSSHFRMDENIPLVIPEVNPEVLMGYRGIIANPNCSTTQMIVAISPLYKKYGIKRIVVSTYQAVSGSGYKAIEELENQVKDKTYGNSIYTRKIAGNCIPHIDVFEENGFSKEELKMVYETHKILKDKTIEINPTAVRIPVVYGHSESIYLELGEEANVKEIKNVLENSKGIIVEDNLQTNEYPTPLEVEGTDPTYVGRIRKDLYNPKGVSLWVVADNLRKGAALNAIQIIELLETMK